MAVRIQLRRGTTAEWATADPILAQGEVGVDLDTAEMRLGDGTTAWSTLPPIGAVDPADVDAAVVAYLSAHPPAAVPDATATTKGTVQLTGDLGGTADAPTVPGLAGKEPARGTDDNYVTDAEKANLHTHPAVIAQGATQADARSAIGAGTSSLALGTTADTAKAGDYEPDLSGLSARLDALEAGGVGSVVGIAADDTPASPAEGESASYLVSSAVTWPAGLVWSTDPDGGVAPTITGTALVSMFTLGGVTRAIMGATFPAPVAPPDTTAPSIPAGLSATATGSATVNLTWSASTDDTAVTGYEYRVGGGASVDAGAGLTETVTGLTASTLYSFEVRAYDAAGNRSAWSTAASATTDAPPADSTPPTVGTMAASSITADGFTLTATGASDAVALHATPYAFTIDGGSTWSAYQASPVYVASGLTAATGYSCNWRVRDAAGNVSTGTAQTVTTDAAPTADWAAYDAAVAALTPHHELKLSTDAANTGTSAATFTATDVTFGAAIAGTTGGDFNGSTSSITGPVGTVGSGTAAFTIEAVITPDALSSYRDIAGPGIQSQLLGLANGKVGLWLGNTAGHSVVSESLCTIGQTYHVAGTYDGATIRVYVNGVLAGSAARAGTVSAAAAAWRVGWVGAGRFDGRITRVAAYTSVLSAATLLDHAQKAGLA